MTKTTMQRVDSITDKVFRHILQSRNDLLALADRHDVMDWERERIIREADRMSAVIEFWIRSTCNRELVTEYADARKTRQEQVLREVLSRA